MEQSSIPQEVQKLLAEHVESLDQLEILLLLHQDPAVAWTATQVARELRINEGPAAARLATFAERGLLASEGSGTGQRYRYEPANLDLAHAVDDLEQVYRERRVAVITFIFSKPNQNIRTFADAFRLRKDK